MEKIKRYDLVVYDHDDDWLDEDGSIAAIDEIENGDFIKHEDHIAALKEIFPDWPGEYPTKTGHYYFMCSTGVIEPRFVYLRDGFASDRDDYKICKYSKPEDWGPLVPMWRKI